MTKPDRAAALTAAWRDAFPAVKKLLKGEHGTLKMIATPPRRDGYPIGGLIDYADRISPTGRLRGSTAHFAIADDPGRRFDLASLSYARKMPETDAVKEEQEKHREHVASADPLDLDESEWELRMRMLRGTAEPVRSGSELMTAAVDRTRKVISHTAHNLEIASGADLDKLAAAVGVTRRLGRSPHGPVRGRGIIDPETDAELRGRIAALIKPPSPAALFDPLRRFEVEADKARHTREKLESFGERYSADASIFRSELMGDFIKAEDVAHEVEEAAKRLGAEADAVSLFRTAHLPREATRIDTRSSKLTPDALARGWAREEPEE